MNYLMTYNDFLNENTVTGLYTNEFRNIISKIDSPISKMILSFDKPLDISQINPSDSENLVTYIRNGGKKEAMKIGAIVTKILTELGETVHPTVMEKFINEYRGIISSIKSITNFDIVYGENIRKFYFENTYADGGGSLNNSCMRHDYCQPYLDMFVDNPDKINLLILRNSTNKMKIDGRALLWNLDNGKKFLDFPYTTKDHMYKTFEEYARKKGWYYTLMEQNKPTSLDNHYRFLDVYNNGNKVDDVFIVSLTPQEYETYPYLDIMRFYNPDTGHLTNVLDKDDDDIIILDNDKGEYRKLTYHLLDEKRYEEKPALDALPKSKSIPNEMKELITPYLNSNSTYKNKKVFDLTIPKINGKSFDGVSMGADKKGFFVYTHRARCHSYESPEKIPNDKIEFIKSTG